MADLGHGKKERFVKDVEINTGNLITYETHPTFSADTEIVDKKFVDDAIITSASKWTQGAGSIYPATISNKVSIGIAHPGTSAKLVVYASSGTSDIHLCNVTSGTGLGDGFWINAAGTEVQLRQKENDSLKFYTNNAERGEIDSTGEIDWAYDINLTASAAKFTHNANPLAIDAKSTHWAIGADHCKYSTISTAITNVSSPSATNVYLFDLANETFTENPNFASDSYVTVNGPGSIIKGEITCHNKHSFDVFAITPPASGDYCIYGVGPGTGTSFLKADYLYSENAVDGMVVAGDNNTIDFFVNDIENAYGPMVGGTADHIGEINGYVNEIRSTYNTANLTSALHSEVTTSRIKMFANTITGNTSTGTSTVVKIDAGEVYLTANIIYAHTNFIDANGGKTFVKTGFFSGATDITGGDVYLDALQGNGNISIAAGSTLYTSILDYSGVITNSGNIRGRIGNTLYADGELAIRTTTGVGFEAIDSTNEGGRTTWKGAGSYSDIVEKNYQNDHFFAINNSSVSSFKIFNSGSGNMQFYSDSIDNATHQTLYVTSGYLTTSAPSDPSLKENVVSLGYGFLDKFKGFDFIKFNWILGGKESVGLLSTNVAAVYPDCVLKEKVITSFNGEGETKTPVFEEKETLDLDRIKMYHMKTTQELITMVFDLEARLLKLEANYI